MKKLCRIILLSLILLLPYSIKALEVTSNNVTIAKGKTKSIELYANVTEEIKSVTFTLTFTTYDVPAYYAEADGITDTTPNSITHKITFNENKTGRVYLGNVVISTKQYPNDTSGTINISSAKAITINDEEISLKAQDINVTIGEETSVEVKKDPNLLDKIESKIVNIELKKDVFEYEVEVASTVKELDLKATPKESSTNVDISSQKIEENKENTIVITAKNGDTEQKYNIKIKIKKTEETPKETKTNTNIDISTNNQDNIKPKGYDIKWIIVIIIMIIIILVGIILNRKKK